MTFKRAIEDTPSISNSYRCGLQALTAGDRARITLANSSGLAGSLNLDEALRKAQPHASRWDYGIGIRQSGRKLENVLWVEIHPASSSHNPAEVKGKLIWLKGWLASEGKRLGALNRSFVWVCSGRATFNSKSPQIRELADMGLVFGGRHHVAQ